MQLQIGITFVKLFPVSFSRFPCGHKSSLFIKKEKERQKKINSLPKHVAINFLVSVARPHGLYSYVKSNVEVVIPKTLLVFSFSQTYQGHLVANFSGCSDRFLESSVPVRVKFRVKFRLRLFIYITRSTGQSTLRWRRIFEASHRVVPMRAPRSRASIWERRCNLNVFDVNRC